MIVWDYHVINRIYEFPFMEIEDRYSAFAFVRLWVPDRFQSWLLVFAWDVCWPRAMVGNLGWPPGLRLSWVPLCLRILAFWPSPRALTAGGSHLLRLAPLISKTSWGRAICGLLSHPFLPDGAHERTRWVKPPSPRLIRRVERGVSRTVALIRGLNVLPS